MDAVNALLPAVDDGLFEKYITTEKILDVKLAAHNRTAIVPLASLVTVQRDQTDYTSLHIDSPFDTVIVPNVLEDMNYPLSLIAFAYGRLEVGGHLIISVPHRDLYERRLSPPGNFDKAHQNFYTPERLLLQVQAACGINSVRLRFAKDYDWSHNYDDLTTAHAKGGYSTLVVLEKIG